MSHPDTPPGNGAGGAPLSREALSAWTHDLRNPLAALVANIHHLRETLGAHLDPDSEEVFAECLALFGLLERYTANLDVLAQADASPLDVGSVERGRPLDLLELANEVATRLGPYASVTGHRFRVIVQGATPPRVETDRTILRRILENLAANALENAPSGPVDLVVGTHTPSGKDAAARTEGSITVVDRGPPWPVAAPVTSTYSSKRAPGSRYGRGLGVDAARLAAQALGARIELTNSAAGEATAILSVPLTTSSSGPAAEEPA